jgi:hypothetical protein
MVHVSKDLGLSDRGLAKICAHYQIPVPPRGYWAKKSHGYDVNKTPLPSLEVSSDIHFDPERPAAVNSKLSSNSPAIAFELQPENRIVVAPQPGRPHRFVTKTRAALRQAKAGHRGLLWPTGGCLDVTVSRQQVSRALRIMNAVLKAFDARGWVSSMPAEDRGLTVCVLGESLRVALDEKTSQVPHVPTAPEHNNLASNRPQFDLAPSGALRFRIGHDYWSKNETADTDARALEESLNRFFIRLIKGVPLAQVRDLLGHASITTTERYDTQTLESLQMAARRLERGESFDTSTQERVGSTKFQDSFNFPIDRFAASDTVAPTDVGAKPLVMEEIENWLGGRDSNPDNVVQSHVSYR